MKALLQKIRQILRDRKTRRIFTRLVSTVAAIVVFVTTYALVLPAITMESGAACGIEAHQHDQSCYTDILVCEIPENPGHVHDEFCYSMKQKQVCQIEEHVHDSDCYDGNGKLICEKDEHQHGEVCFEEVRELVCEIPESPGHQHDDSCYQKVLTCDKEVHTHSTACYHVDTAGQAAAEAIGFASTESAAASAENSLDDSLDSSPDNSLPEKAATALTNEVSSDEAGEWASTEAAADATTGTAAATGATDAEEISTELSLVEPGINPDPDTEETVNAVDAVNAGDTEAAAADNKQDTPQDSEAEDGASDNAETEQVSYPSVSFDDSITVASGALSTDTDAMSGDAGTETGTETEIIVHVEADNDTFPEGTTMVLSAVSDDQMSAVAEAVEGAVEAPKTRGFHAVDISFRDAEGNEIEPLKPIRVSMTSDAIKRAVEDGSTAPVVVHVSDFGADKPAPDEGMGEGGSAGAANAGNAEYAENADEVEDDQRGSGRSERIDEQASENAPESHSPAAAVIETDTGTEKDHGDTLTFNAESFSVYAIVYTVDFHWEVNGKKYDFSIPGGGFVSFEHLVEVLGIGLSDSNSENGDNEASGAAASADENTEGTEGEGGQISEDGADTYNEAIKLNEAEVSEATRKFVADVENVEFSSPELVWVGKADEAVTVGGLKEANKLKINYSGDLTEEQIAAINAQTVEAGDWALISMRSFTSEETLTVTMKNGDQFEIRMTDAVAGAFPQSYNIDIVGDGSITLTEYVENWFWYWDYSYEETRTYYSARTVNLSTRYGQNTNNQDIVANPGSGYIFDHWEINGVVQTGDAYSTSIIPAGTHIVRPWENLTAVFKKSSGGGGGGEVVDFETIIGEWIAKLTKDQPTIDKSAAVYDYENRIYKIDISASSELYGVNQNLDLDFVTDVSGSMLFPSKLEPVTTFSNASDMITQLNNVVRENHGYLPSTTDPSEKFYINMDPRGASNVFVIRRYNGKWYCLAAAYSDEEINVTNIVPNAAGSEHWRELNVRDENGEVLYNNFSTQNNIEKKIYTATDMTKRLVYLKRALTIVKDVLYKVNPDAKIGVTTFADTVYSNRFYTNSQIQQLANDITNIATHGGTRQDLGLEAGKTLLDSETDSTRKKAVVLITDGAPNGCSWGQIQEKAQDLKDRGIDVFTIGLSVENVDGASEGLLDTSDGYGYAFDTKDGRGLVEAIETIIEALTTKANMTGSVSDTIDPAFYPVDGEGNPLQPNVEYQDEQGNKYTLTKNGDTWTVNWANQSFGWTYTDNQGNKQPGWKGTVYVKAKENFLGGNAVKTNSGTDSDKVTVTGFQTLDLEEGTVINSGVLKDENGSVKTIVKTLDTPYVNVDELALTSANTEWKVYLGTEVDPAGQLVKLLKNIDIRKVVSGDTNEMITSKDQMLNGTGAASKTMKLTDYLGLTTEAQITSLVNQLLSGSSKTYYYNSSSFASAYGHGYVGDIVISLVETSGCYQKGNHATEAVGKDAEFTLKVEYRPRTNTERNSELNITDDDYHTTPGGSAGTPVPKSGNDMTSSNHHVINVYVKGLQITKKDQLFTNKLTGAEFKLYRTARAGETENLIEINGKQFFPVATLDMTTNSTVTIEQINALREGEEYYLVETKAPDGYLMLADPVSVNLELTNTYTPKPGDTASSTKPATGPYSWTQSAKLTLGPSSWVRRTDETGTNDLTQAALSADTQSETMYYDIANNAGAELPSTGGPGTDLIYLFGIILTGIAGAGMITKRRRKTA